MIPTRTNIILNQMAHEIFIAATNVKVNVDCVSTDENYRNLCVVSIPPEWPLSGRCLSLRRTIAPVRTLFWVNNIFGSEIPYGNVFSVALSWHWCGDQKSSLLAHWWAAPESTPFTGEADFSSGTTENIFHISLAKFWSFLHIIRLGSAEGHTSDSIKWQYWQ